MTEFADPIELTPAKPNANLWSCFQVCFPQQQKPASSRPAKVTFADQKGVSAVKESQCCFVFLFLGILLETHSILLFKTCAVLNTKDVSSLHEDDPLFGDSRQEEDETEYEDATGDELSSARQLAGLSDDASSQSSLARRTAGDAHNHLLDEFYRMVMFFVMFGWMRGDSKQKNSKQSPVVSVPSDEEPEQVPEMTGSVEPEPSPDSTIGALYFV